MTFFLMMAVWHLYGIEFVQMKSILGTQFMLSSPIDYTYTRLGFVSLFTYNYDVIVNVEANITLQKQGAGDSTFCQEHQALCGLNISRVIVELPRHVPYTFKLEMTRAEALATGGYMEFQTIHMTANDEFGVNVLYVGNSNTLALYFGLPYKAYGLEYIIFLLKEHQFYNVFIPAPETQAILYNDYGNRGYVLYEQGAYPNKMKAIFNCNYTDHGTLSLLGRIINATGKIGIISGSCLSNTNETNLQCDMKTDASVDTLLPTQYAAKEYIAFDPSSQSYVELMGITKQKAEVFVYTSEDEHVKYSVSREQHIRVNLRKNGFQMIRSDVPIQVYLVTASSCQGDSSSSVTSLIAVLLYFNQYIWSIPLEKVGVSENYMILFKKSDQEYHFLYDGKKLPLSGWIMVAGSTLWSGQKKQLEPSEENLHTLASKSNRAFGLYLYGSGNGHSYLSYVNFMLSKPHNPKVINYTCVPSKMIIGDLKDNDCDERFDEESAKDTDDDGDGLFGEDIIVPVPEYFNKFSQSKTKPPTPSTTTPLVSELLPTTSEPLQDDTSTRLLLILLLIIPLILMLLYYIIRKKHPRIVVGEEMQAVYNVDDGISKISRTSGTSNSKPAAAPTAFAAPGRTKSTFLH